MKQTSKISRKVISIVLSLLMVFSCFSGMSLTAYADAPAEKWTTDTIVTESRTINGYVSVGADITLTINKGVTLTINDSIESDDYTLTVNGKGTLNVTGSESEYAISVMTIIVDGATVIAKGGSGRNGTDHNPVAGTFNGTNGSYGGEGIYGNVTVKSGSVNVYGGNGGNGGSSETDGTSGGRGNSAIEGNVTIEGGSLTATGGKGGNGGTILMGGSGPNGANGVAVSGTITGENVMESDDNNTWTAVSGTSSTKRYIKAEASSATEIEIVSAGGTDYDTDMYYVLRTENAYPIFYFDIYKEDASQPDIQNGKTYTLDNMMVGYTYMWLNEGDAYSYSSAEFTKTVNAEGLVNIDATVEATNGETYHLTYAPASVADKDYPADAPTEWYEGDSINLNGAWCYYMDIDDSYVVHCADFETTVPKAYYYSNYETFEFEGVINCDIYDYNGYRRNYGSTLDLGCAKPEGNDESVLPIGFKIKSGNGHRDNPFRFDLIFAETPTLTDANKPTANTGLVESGNDQALVTAPAEIPDGYTIQYSLDGETWTSDIPKGNAAGDYTVKSKLVGDDYHEDIAIGDIAVKIKGVSTITTENVTAAYGDTGVKVSATTDGDGAISYRVVEGEDVVDVDEATGEVTIKKAGTALVIVKAAATDNYAEKTAKVLVTINKAETTITAKDVTATLGDTDKSVSAAANSDGAISYAVKEGSEEYIDVNAETGALTLKKAGKATVVVSVAETENYKAATKEVTVTINEPAPTPAPAPAKETPDFLEGVKAKATDKKVTFNWGKVDGADRYVIYAAYCGKGNKYKKYKTVKSNVTKIEIKKLNGKKVNPKKNIKVYVVAQKKVNGKYKTIFTSPKFHIAGAKTKYSNVKKITVKKSKYTLNKGKTAKISATLVLENKNKKAIAHAAKFRYKSTDTKVVKVDKNGKITAKGKGTATVFVYSNNGTAKAIKVTVK